MSMQISGSLSVNAYGTSGSHGAQGGQRAGTPTFAHQKVWKSIGEMDTAWRNLTKEWAGYYAEAFAGTGAEGNGKITTEELDGLLQSEFGGMGVRFTDAPVDETNPKAGTFEVHIDGKTRQKMADDPEYRAKVMAVIQSEMAGAKGYAVQTDAGVHRDRTTGLSMNMIDGGPIYEGVPHSAGGTSASGGVMFTTTGGGSDGKKNSILDQILEKLEEKRAEKKEVEKKEAARKAREERLDLHVEVEATLSGRPAGKTDGTTGTASDNDPSKTSGAGLNILA